MTHAREFGLRIFQVSFLVSPQQGFSQTNKARLVNSHRLFDTGTTCKCMRFCNIVQASCVTPETSMSVFLRSIRVGRPGIASAQVMSIHDRFCKDHHWYR